MNRRYLIGLVAAAGLTIGAVAQIGEGRALSKPLTESELLNTIDSLAQGDPVTRQPLSIGDGPTVGARKKAERPPKKDKGPTVITGEAATFDQRTHQAVFTGNVVVEDPEFTITECQRLTAELRTDPPPAKPGETPPKASAGDNKGGGLRRAVAEAVPGKKLVITQDKVEADGTMKRYVARAERADYNAINGKIVLTGWPEVAQRGSNTVVATKASTVITLMREGEMKVDGDFRMLLQEKLDTPAR